MLTGLLYVMAITKDTLVIDNHLDKEIHGRLSGKRTELQCPL